jgi:class 3 adenylate cyclase
VELVKRHDGIVKDSLDDCGGRIVKHTGDGVLASFTSVIKAVESTLAIHRRVAEAHPEGAPLAVKIGLTVGEPVQDSNDLFGASVNLAARICAHARGGQTLASGTVHDLALGSGIEFKSMGAIGLKGFPDPVPLYEISWSAPDS